MDDSKIIKITCSECGKWLARVDLTTIEHMAVITPCPKCRNGEGAIEVSELIRLLERALLDLRAWQQVLTRPIPQDDGQEPVPRLLIGGAGKRDRG